MLLKNDLDKNKNILNIKIQGIFTILKIIKELLKISIFYDL